MLSLFFSIATFVGLPKGYERVQLENLGNGLEAARIGDFLDFQVMRSHLKSPESQKFSFIPIQQPWC